MKIECPFRLTDYEASNFQFLSKELRNYNRVLFLCPPQK